MFQSAQVVSSSDLDAQILKSLLQRTPLPSVRSFPNNSNITSTRIFADEKDEKFGTDSR